MRGFGLPGCGSRRDGADLDEAEAQRQQRVDVLAVLVQARGQADRIGEGEAEGPGRQRPAVAAPAAGSSPLRYAGLQRRQRQRMRALGDRGRTGRGGRAEYMPRSALAEPDAGRRRTARRCRIAEHARIAMRGVARAPSPAIARPSPCRRAGSRRISPRAMWPVTIATRLPSSGSNVQPRMPAHEADDGERAGVSGTAAFMRRPPVRLVLKDRT